METEKKIPIFFSMVKKSSFDFLVQIVDKRSETNKIKVEKEI